MKCPLDDGHLAAPSTPPCVHLEEEGGVEGVLSPGEAAALRVRGDTDGDGRLAAGEVLAMARQSGVWQDPIVLLFLDK